MRLPQGEGRPCRDWLRARRDAESRVAEPRDYQNDVTNVYHVARATISLLTSL